MSLRIYRFRIADNLGWTETGTLSFLNEGVESIGFFRQYLRRDHEAYVDVDVTGRVIWDPTALIILGRSADDTLPFSAMGWTFLRTSTGPTSRSRATCFGHFPTTRRIGSHGVPTPKLLSTTRRRASRRT